MATPLHVTLLGLLILIVGISEVIVWNGGPALLYCYGWSPIYRAFLLPYASLVLVVCVGYFVWSMATAGLVSAKSMGAVLIIFLVGNLDGWARVFLALGKRCQ